MRPPLTYYETFLFFDVSYNGSIRFFFFWPTAGPGPVLLLLYFGKSIVGDVHRTNFRIFVQASFFFSDITSFCDSLGPFGKKFKSPVPFPPPPLDRLTEVHPHQVPDKQHGGMPITSYSHSALVLLTTFTLFFKISRSVRSSTMKFFFPLLICPRPDALPLYPSTPVLGFLVYVRPEDFCLLQHE